MFSNKHDKKLSGYNLPTAMIGDDIPSIIAADLKIVGNLICGGALEIEGEIEGNVSCSNVTIRRSGIIKGDLVADNILVDGEVNGLVKGQNITLTENARVTGVIMYETLSVKDGAYIDGQCKSSDKVNRRDNVEVIDSSEASRLEEEDLKSIDDSKSKASQKNSEKKEAKEAVEA